LSSQKNEGYKSPWQTDPARTGLIEAHALASDSDPTDRINLNQMIRYRYQRLQQQIGLHRCDAVLLFSPMNVRYASETVYAPITNMHSPTRAIYVPAEGKATLFDSATDIICDLPDCIGEQRDSVLMPYFIAGDLSSDRAGHWVKEVTDLVKQQSEGFGRIAIDIAEPEFVTMIQATGLQVVNAERIVERASAVKSDDELAGIMTSISVAEQGLARIRENLKPGITEQGLWAHLAFENAAQGGHWFEYSILASGTRSNPWGRECSDKTIETGELVGVDTGMIGPYGYCADISRTFLCGPSGPSNEQKRLYQYAIENLAFNIELIQAGMGFREYAEKSWTMPPEFRNRRYNSVAHGVGMGNEWPHIPFFDDWEVDDKRDDVFEENMVIAIESCIGREDGDECVKLEEMVVVKQGKCQLVSSYPFEQILIE
jgi:Xaa-Pro aminopeptidase